MEKKNDENKTQEFHFGDWTSSSENDSQEAYDSDTICPISLNDLINIEKKSQNQKQDDDTDFIIPSLADSINNNSHFDNQDKLKNKENIYNASVSKILYDFTQNATVLGFDSSFSSHNDDDENEEKINYTTQTINNTNMIDDNDERLKSFTSLVQNEQTFVKLHQKCFSSSSDSDIFVVTNNEEVLEPDSDSSTDNTFEEFQLSQVKQARSQVYDSKVNNNGSKSLDLLILPKSNVQKTCDIKKSQIKQQSSPTRNNEECIQNKNLITESPETSNNNNNNININKSSNFLKESKILNSSSQKRVTLNLTSSDSSSSINLDSDNTNQIKFKNTNQKKSPNRSINIVLANRKRHLNTLNKFNLNDFSYSSTSYSYSDEENNEEQIPSNFIDSLDSTVSMKNSTEPQKNQKTIKNQTQKNDQIQTDKNHEINKNQTQTNEQIQINANKTQQKNESKQKTNKNQTQTNDQIQINANETQQKNESKQKTNKNQTQANDQIQIDANKTQQKNESKQKANKNQTQTNEQIQIDKNQTQQQRNEKDQKNPTKSNDQNQLNKPQQKVENDQKEDKIQTDQTKNISTKDTSSSSSKIIFLQKVEYNDTIAYPKPKKKNTKNESKNNETKSTNFPNLYPIVPPIILSPIKDDEKAHKENSDKNDKEFNSSSEKQNKIKDENKNDEILNLSSSSSIESSKNSMYEIESPLKKSNKDINSASKSGNNSVLKTASFNTKSKENSIDFENKSDSENWIDDDPCNPSDLILNENSNESIMSQKETEKEKIDKKIEFEINSKNFKEKIDKETNINKNKISFNMNQLNVPVFSFFEFISELPLFNDIDFISIVLTINGLFNLPPPSGVSQLDLVLHFQNLRCTPIVLNLKSARFRTGKYETVDSNQLLIRIPLFSPNFLPRSFFCTENSDTISSIDEIYSRKRNENENLKDSKSSLIEINGFDSKKLVLTFELMGNGKRICGSNLVLIEKNDDDDDEGKVDVAPFGKHFLRLMLRPNMKCELKKGEKEALIEVQINKVDQRDEKQMKHLPYFSIIHVFFVDSVVAYRQVLERYRIQKAGDIIGQKEFNLLSFFAPASTDLVSMKKFAKSFKDAMKKLPKDRRGDDDKLKLFVDILRGSVIQELTNSKSKNNSMIPFSTTEISALNS